MLKDQKAGRYDVNLTQSNKTNFGDLATNGLGVAQGVMQLGSQIGNNLSTSSIGHEVQGVQDISRGDIMNTNIHVDSNKTNSLGQAASGALTGAKTGSAFGPVGTAIGAGIGAIAGGVSSIFGNKAKEKAAQKAEDI